MKGYKSFKVVNKRRMNNCKTHFLYNLFLFNQQGKHLFFDNF